MQDLINRGLFKSDSRNVWYLAMTFVFIVCIAAFWVAWYERNDFIHDERDRANLFVRILEDQISRVIDHSSQISSELSDEMTNMTPLQMSRVRPSLEKALISAPAIRSLSVVNMEGEVLLSSHLDDEGRKITIDGLLPNHNGQSDIHSLLPVRFLSEIDQPHLNGRAINYSLPLVRAMQGRDGTRYLLVALLNPEYLLNVMTLALSDTGYSAYLKMTSSRQIVAAFNGALRIGQSLNLNESIRDKARSSGLATYIYIGDDGSGENALLALRRLRNWPLTTIIERPMSHVLGAWLELLTWLAMMTCLAIFVIVTMSYLAVRSMRARDKALSRLVGQLSFTEKLLEISPLPIYTVDPQGVIINVNRALESFMGLKREQMLNQPTSRFLSDADLYSQQINNQFLLTRGGQLSYERRLVMPDGKERDLLLNKVVVSSDEGLPRGVLTVILDVTQFRDAERATLQARDAAEMASLAKSEFISNMSHELRTPLQSILGFSELGLMQVNKNDTVYTMLEDIHSAGHKMLNMVNDLLDVAKIENPDHQGVFEHVDLADLINTVKGELEPQRLAKYLHINAMNPGCSLRVLADSHRMQQVIRNLLANAIKFSPPGATIDIRFAKVGSDRVQLSILDQGCGIPPDELERIFDPFVQSSLTKDGSGGTGLGLAICRRILMMHKGTIVAENRQQGGAVFIVELPLLSEEAKSAE